MRQYLNHLYTLVNGRVELIATSDILDADGNPTVRKQGLISPEIYPKIKSLNSQLTIEEHITFAHPIDSNELLHLLQKTIKRDYSLCQIHEKIGDETQLKKCCDYIYNFPYAKEILTAFSIETPDLFDQSLVSSYLACLLGQHQKLKEDDLNQLFLAAIFHDVGLLFIQRKIRNNTSRKFTGDEWRKLQLHPIIAEKMLREIKTFPSSSRKAILEHHENVDGSGYPFGKKLEKISPMALMIGLIDDAVAIYRKKFRPFGRSMYDVYPIIQMNTHNYPQDIISSMLFIIKQVPISISKNIEKSVVKDLIEYTYEQQLFINKIMDIIKQIHRNINDDYGIKALRNLINEHKQLGAIIDTSGLNESNYIEWLQRLDTDKIPELYNEVEHTRLMLEEVIYRLNNFYNRTTAFVSKTSSDLADGYKVLLQIYSSTTQPTLPYSIVNFWHR